jgi:hypothetical protein
LREFYFSARQNRRRRPSADKKNILQSAVFGKRKADGTGTTSRPNGSHQARSTQFRQKKLAGIGCRVVGHLLGSSRGDHPAALLSALGTQIDDVVGSLDDV